MADVWLLSEGGGNSARELRVRLRTMATELRLNLSVNSPPQEAWLHIPAKRDDVVVVFQHPNSESSKLPLTRWSWCKQCQLLPVVNALDHAAELPPFLRELNAFVRDRYPAAEAVDVLADEVIARAVLARRSRQIFISYQRSATLGVAQQLASALQGQGFDTFLDERSVPLAVNFDTEIGYRLNDVDLVIFLATESFRVSRWVQKEIAFANNASIGIIAIDCDSRGGRNFRGVLGSLMVDQIFSPTQPVANKGDELSKTDLESLLSAVHRQRVACIVRRVHNLLPAAEEFLRTHHPNEEVICGPELGELSVGSRRERTRVIPFRPTPETLWNLHRDARDEHIGLMHPENVPRDPRVRALRWLSLPPQLRIRIDDVRRLWT